MNKSHQFAINYLRVTALTTAFIGIVLLLRPEIIMEWFIPSANSDFFTRFIGSALLGFSTLNWLAGNSRDMKTYRIALEANIVALSIATILSVIGVVSGVVERLGWLLISEHIIFTVLFIWTRITVKTSK